MGKEMTSHDAEQIRHFWQGRARSAEVAEHEVTHRDVWQRHLEIEMIKKFVSPTDRVLDIGCGNGFTTRLIAPLVRDIVGMDYTEEMINRALKEAGANERGPLAVKAKGVLALYDLLLRRSRLPGGSLTFKVKDVLALGPEDFGLFDLVISERCLINLESWDDQKRAISNIASVITPGGRFIFVEGSKQGRENLNKLRRAVGLETMPTVWHNIDFDEEETLAHLSRYFTIEEKLHFGVYDFISRVAHPLIVTPEGPQYDCRMNEVASLLALHCQEFGEISRSLFLVLKRKS